MNIKLTQPKSILEYIIYYTAIFISLFFSLCVVVASALMLAGFVFSIVIPIIAFVVCAALVFFDTPKENRLLILAGVVIMLVLIVATCLYLGGLYFDISYDGQWHHQEGIIRLIKGWNPYSSDYPFGNDDSMYFVNHYPQGDALALSSIFVFFKHNIELAKGLNFLLGICAFLLLVKAFSCLLRERDKLQQCLIVVLAFVIVSNPVAVTQWFTFYLDGRLFYESVILTALIIICHYKQNVLLKIAIIFNIIFLINIKFTGIEYTCLICGTYILFLLTGKQFKNAIKFAAISLLTIILSITVVGYGSYVKNYIHTGSALYPIVGAGNITGDIEQSMGPKNFESLNNFEKFYYSTTALPVWSRNPLNSQQRALFKMSDVSYYQQYYRPDTEMNGFGVFFAELILLSIPGLIVVCFARKSIASWYFIWIIYFLLFISIVVNPVSFIARYAPQAWLLPIIPIFGLIFLKKKIAGIYALVLLLLLLTNSVLVSTYNLSSLSVYSALLSNQLVDLKKQNKPVIISAKWTSLTERLSEHNIKFIRVSRLYPADSIPLESSFGMAFIKK